MKRSVKQVFKIAVPIAILAVAATVLWKDLHTVDIRVVLLRVRATSPSALGISSMLTVASFASLVLLERCLFRLSGQRMGWPEVMAGAVISNAIAAGVGLVFVTATALRLQVYNRPQTNQTRVLLVSLLAGPAVMLCGGVTISICLLAFPVARSALFLTHPYFVVATSGPALIVGALILALKADRVFTIRGIEIRVPPLRTRVCILLSAIMDWITAGGALFVLLGDSVANFPMFETAFVCGWLLGVVSGAPAGIGALDATILSNSSIPPSEVVAALVMFRIIYFACPIVVAMSILLVSEGAKLKARRSP